MMQQQPPMSEQDYYSKALGRNPWEQARQMSARAQSEAMVDELLKAGMIDKATAAKAKQGGGDPMDLVNQDPAFLNKVFKK